MPKCPSCSKRITYLRVFRTGVLEEMHTFGDAKVIEEVQFVPDSGKPMYECPECGEAIFTSEVKADEFLKQREDDPKSELVKVVDVYRNCSLMFDSLSASCQQCGLSRCMEEASEHPTICEMLIALDEKLAK